MDARLDFALELEQRDAAVAERLEALARLEHEAGRLRARAAGVAALLERAPAEHERLAAAVEAARDELERRRAEQAEAQAAQARARGDDARAAAERELARAEAATRDAAERLERADALRAELEEQTERARDDARALAADATRLAGELRGTPRVGVLPDPGEPLEAVLEWAARAQAAVLVARGGLAAERDRIFREANELAAVVLGEPLLPSSVTAVRERVEQRVAGGG